MRRAISSLLGLLALAAGSAAQDAPPTQVPPAATPPPTEAPASRWVHNPRARTAVGIERLGEGEADAALDAFDSALALQPDDPRLQFNAGAASLLSGGDADLELLSAAAENAPADLRAAAHYNLGNARLDAGDPGAAIEAYEESLRVAPGNLDAKHNLEVARRILEEQEQQQQQQQQQQDDQEGDGETQDQSEEQPSGEDDTEQDQSPPQPESGDSDPEAGERPPDDAKQPLPNFEEQPEMTAEQAAAILEAVENLEREQRRQQALEQRKLAKGEHDW